VVRPRLLATLRGRWDRPVTAVIGGPGSGKSTLLGQAVTENRLDPQGHDLWVRCVESDAAASQFAGVLCAALGTEPPPGEDHDVLVDAIVEALLTHAPVATCIVIDDLHVIPDTSEGAALLGRLVTRLPATAHLVLCGRRKPPVPMARLVAHGEAVVVTEGDLVFTPDEVAAFADLRGVSATALAAVGPWPAIAELTASAGPSVVADYLWEEVLGRLAPERRRQLAALAAIGGGDRELVERATGAPADLEDLLADVPLMAVTVDGWIELHALWHDQLAGELSTQERRVVQRRAGQHLLATGDRLRAFRLLADAGAAEEVAALVLEVCGHVYLPVEPDVLAGWVPVLAGLDPASELPETTLLRGLLAKERTGELAAAQTLLEHACAAFTSRGDVVGEMACLVHLFSIGYSLDDSELVARTIGRATALADGGHPAAAAIAAIGRSAVADYFGDFREALRLIDDAPELATEEWAAIRAWMRAELLESLGHPAAALQTLEARAHRDAGLIGDQLAAARVQALWSAGRIEEAVEDGLPALTGAQTCGSARTAQRANALAARLHAHLGHEEAADELLRVVDQYPAPDRVLERRRHVSRAVRHVLAGDETRAAAELAWLLDGDQVNTFLAAQKTVLRVLPLVYVLVPATRARWDEAELGPTFAGWRTLAQALVAARERGDATLVATLPPLGPGSVRAALPLPWVVELATLLEHVGRPEGRTLLQAIGAPARPFVEALTRTGLVDRAAGGLLKDMPNPPEHAVEVRLLGPPELWRGGSMVDDAAWRRDRVRQLLAFLVLHPSTTRDAVADALWPELDADAAANNLRGTLSHLLGVLQPGRRSRDPSYFVARRDRHLLLAGTDRLRIDVWDFESGLDRAEQAERAGTPSVALTAYREAIVLWRGPLAADAPWPWAEHEAERLRTRFVAATGRAAELASAAGEGDEAERLALTVLDLDPWSERAYRVLATAQLDRGDRPGAELTLRRCRTALRELGVEPDAATRMVERRLAPGSDGPGS